MMIKTILVEKFRASLNFINVLQRSGGEWALGRESCEVTEGEGRLLMVQRPILQGTMTCESTWRLFVFWVPNIYWRILYSKVEEIPEDSIVRNVHKHARNVHKHAQAINNSRSTVSQGGR